MKPEASTGSDRAPEVEPSTGIDFARVREVLRAAAARVVPHWLADQREDIVQQAMVRLLGVLERGDPAGRASAGYLWRIAYSVTIDEIRRRRSRPEAPPNESTPEASDPLPNPERMAGSKQVGLAIRDCLGRVSDDRRRALSLYLQGHGASEIAQMMGWNSKRAENLLARGLADLRACLSSKGVTP